VRILTINSGSSSIKFSIYTFPGEQHELSGELSRIGQPDGAFRVRRAGGETVVDQKPALPDHAGAFKLLLDWLGEQTEPDAVGHRIVHGGPDYRDPQIVSPDVISRLRELIPLAPNHLPRELDAIELISRSYANVPQVGCFDTAFHRGMPEIAQVYALPESVRQEGVVLRYGFHGLSYEYICGELERLGAGKGRVIVCHLGNGASMAAIRDGRSVDTTMGFTPTGGLVMSTRCGDIDPEVVLYLIEELELEAKTVRDIITKHGGLMGLSHASADMQDLHRRERDDPKAALAIAVFCYNARKALGSLAAALGGLDTLVFTGGIGENDAAVRQRICEGLEFVGVRLDSAQNDLSAPVISAPGAPVSARVIKTNEELTIARHTSRLMVDA
jgi:acetate kinase